MATNFSQKDFYCVYNDYDVSRRLKEFNLLYLPLIGSDAVRLYQFLGTKILSDKNLSKNYLHYDILDNLALDTNKFLLARKKLEALGLLQTFFIDSDGVRQYIYKIKEALSFVEFFNSPPLSQLLENTVGTSEYIELKNHYSNDRVSFKNLQEITAKFSDVYLLENEKDYSFDTINFEKIKGPNFDEYYFDFAKLNYYLANSYLTDVIEKDSVKNNILGLAHLYKASPQDMAKAIEKSVKIENGNNSLDTEELKDYLLQLYVNVRKQSVPSLDSMLNKKMIEADTNSEELSEEDLFIREVDNTNYITYLNKQRGLVLSNVDAKAIVELQEKYNFPTGVLNILLDFSINLSKSTGLPHKNYIDKIASGWKTQNLLGARDAIDFVRKGREQRALQNNNTNKQKIKTNFSQKKTTYATPFPEYLQDRMQNLSVSKPVENRVVTSEDEDAYNEMLKELNNKRNT